jgi:hypothetical protein
MSTVPEQGGGGLSAIARAAMGGTSGALHGDLPAAVATARAEGVTEGRAAGLKEGAQAAYSRLSTILGHADVKGRESAALDLAIASPDMAAEAVVSFVAKHGAAAAPAADAAPKRDRLDAAMNDPKVTEDAPKGAPSADATWDGIVSGLNTAAAAGRF